MFQDICSECCQRWENSCSWTNCVSIIVAKDGKATCSLEATVELYCMWMPTNAKFTRCLTVPLCEAILRLSESNASCFKTMVGC